MILMKSAFAFKRNCYGRLQARGKFDQFIGCFGIKHALTGNDHRPYGFDQNLRRCSDVGSVGAAQCAFDWRIIDLCRRKLLHCDIVGNFHEHRSEPSHLEMSKSAPHDFRHLISEGDFLDPLRDWRIGLNGSKKMEHLGRIARVADRQKQNRDGIGIGGGDAGKRVFGAGPGLHRKNSNAPAVVNTRETIRNAYADPLLSAYNRSNARRSRGFDEGICRIAGEKLYAFAFEDFGNHVNDFHGTSRLRGHQYHPETMAKDLLPRAEGTRCFVALSMTPFVSLEYCDIVV